MLPIKACNPYHAIVRNRKVLQGIDGRSVFKVYFVDIVGRANPSFTEWDKSGLTPQQYIIKLRQSGLAEGVGFIVAFPHITKVFRFGPESEIVANVRAWSTRDLSPIDLERSEGYVECACLAEAAILADEFEFWADCDAVPTYMQLWSDYVEGPVQRNSKLREYWNGQSSRPPRPKDETRKVTAGTGRLCTRKSSTRSD